MCFACMFVCVWLPVAVLGGGYKSFFMIARIWKLPILVIGVCGFLSNDFGFADSGNRGCADSRNRGSRLLGNSGSRLFRVRWCFTSCL